MKSKHCSSVDTQIPQSCIVYEYKPMGSLRLALDKSKDKSEHSVILKWRRRLCILAEVGSAVEYLHVVNQPPIIHRDIKTDNILLNASFNAALGDFGLARLCPEIQSSVSGVSTRIFGTPGYIDPEYAQSGQITMASDVYSFGIICIEMLTSRRAYDRDMNPPSLIHAFEEAVEDDTLNVLIDNWPKIVSDDLIALAKKCVKSRGNKRPNISQVNTCLQELCNQHACKPEQLSSSEDMVQLPSQCVICMDEDATHALIPCGHKCVCSNHAMILIDNSDVCPMCRRAITGSVKVYDT